jgi:hypothetical protein
MRRSLPDDSRLGMPFAECFKLQIRWTDYSEKDLYVFEENHSSNKK